MTSGTADATTTDTTLDPLALFRLDGKVAIVTGASSGLGERFAHVLHAAGATVIASARRKERLDQLVTGLPGAAAIGWVIGCHLPVAAPSRWANPVDDDFEDLAV